MATPLSSSAEYKNSLALAEEIRNLRAEFHERLTVCENTIQMQANSIRQLQELFATQMVVRGSGPTA